MDTHLPAIAQLSMDGCTAQLANADDPDSGAVEILLYTGSPVPRGGSQLVFDLEGMEIPAGQVPILFAHDSERPIGYATQVSTAGALRLSGQLLSNPDAHKVRRDARDGLQWQASMGVRLLEARYVDADEKLTVNGHEFSDGFLVSRSRLLEGSVLTLGADGATRSDFLRMSAEAGTIPVVAGTEVSMSSETAQDVRGDLAAFLGHFSEDRQGWAALQFAAGRELVDCLSEELARVNKGREAEAEEASARLAEAEGRLAAVASSGYQGQPPAVAEELDTTAVNLVDYGSALLSMSIDDVAELVAAEWGRLGLHERVAFAGQHGADLRDYAALRKHEAAGHVRISWKGVS